MRFVKFWRRHSCVEVGLLCRPEEIEVWQDVYELGVGKQLPALASKRRGRLGRNKIRLTDLMSNLRNIFTVWGNQKGKFRSWVRDK